MKFCTRAEREAFLEAAPRFERMLVHSGSRSSVLSGHQPQGTGAPLARAAPRSTQAVEDQPG